MVHITKTGVLVLAGAVYGLSLTIVGVMLAAGGHGTYLLLDVASAPISFLGTVYSVAGPPLLWSGFCGLLAHSNKAPQRQIAVIVLILHYVAVSLIWFFEELAEWKYFEEVWQLNPSLVAGGLTLYVAGQIGIWIYWFRQALHEKSAQSDV